MTENTFISYCFRGWKGQGQGLHLFVEGGPSYWDPCGERSTFQRLGQTDFTAAALLEISL